MDNLLDAIIAAKLAGGGGGGGGGGGAEFITLVPSTLNVFGGGTWTSNKTFSALASAFDSGASIHVIISNLAFDAAQLAVYQRKGNTLYAHVRFYDGDQINGEFRIFQDGTYAYLDSAVSIDLSAYQLKPITVTISDTVAVIEPEDKHIYNCGELANLKIIGAPSNGAYSIVFTSGTSPTVTSIPSSILGLDNFAPAANTLYEINILDNRAVIGSWAVSA